MCRLKRADPYVLCISNFGLMCLYYEMKIWTSNYEVYCWIHGMEGTFGLQRRVWWFKKMCLISTPIRKVIVCVTLPIVQWLGTKFWFNGDCGDNYCCQCLFSLFCLKWGDFDIFEFIPIYSYWVTVVDLVSAVKLSASNISIDGYIYLSLSHILKLIPMTYTSLSMFMQHAILLFCLKMLKL